MAAGIVMLAACSSGGQQVSHGDKYDYAPDRFCALAESFAARGIRGQPGSSRRAPALSQLERLSAASPPDIRSALNDLVRLEAERRSGRLSTEDRRTLSRLGQRVGQAIEQHCALQLPGVAGMQTLYEPRTR